MNPLQPFLDKQGAVILDGGLATQLEAHGCDLSDALWSARLLIDNPDLIRQVHLDYFWAGADVCISASYQATLQAFQAHGVPVQEAIRLLRLSVQLVSEARDQFWAHARARSGRLFPLVAASIGPYGAYLANGAEYTGDYDLDEDGLFSFHRQRWHLLARTPADIMACETIPSFAEMRALVRLLQETIDAPAGTTASKPAWFSFTAGNTCQISDGTPIAECATYLDKIDQVVAIGINCTPPRHITGLIRAIRAATHKPIIIYPNSGETYDAANNRWLGEAVPAEFGTLCREWRKEGAALLGGCCRTTPAHIQQIRDRFKISNKE